MRGQSQRRSISLLQVGLPNRGAGLRNVKSHSSGLTLGSVTLFPWCFFYNSRSNNSRDFQIYNGRDILCLLMHCLVFCSADYVHVISPLQFHLLRGYRRIHFMCCLNSFLMKSNLLPLDSAYGLLFHFGLPCWVSFRFNIHKPFKIAF